MILLKPSFDSFFFFFLYLEDDTHSPLISFKDSTAVLAHLQCDLVDFN